MSTRRERERDARLLRDAAEQLEAYSSTLELCGNALGPIVRQPSIDANVRRARYLAERLRTRALRKLTP